MFRNVVAPTKAAWMVTSPARPKTTHNIARCLLTNTHCATFISNAPAKAKAKDTSQERPSLFSNAIYEPIAKPFNIATHISTKIFSREPSHPLHIKILRKAAAFDRESFIWVVRCPVQALKSTHRHHIQKKVCRAFKRALAERGYAEDGTILPSVSEGEGEGKGEGEQSEEGGIGSRVLQTDVPRPTRRLSGVLMMVLIRDKERTAQATGAEIDECVRKVLNNVIRKNDLQQQQQPRAGGSKARVARNRADGERSVFLGKKRRFNDEGVAFSQARHGKGQPSS